MVQITQARIVERDTEQLVLATEFDKARYEGKACRCPDKTCPAVLCHHQEHIQTYYNPITGEPFQLKVAAHYGRTSKSPQHAQNCTAMAGYQKFENYARVINRNNLGQNGFVLNLNIPTDMSPAPLRVTKTSHARFSDAAIHNPPPENHIANKYSAGLSNVAMLASLLNQTEENPDHRRLIDLRRGSNTYRLSDIYFDDPIALFRKAHAAAKETIVSAPALVCFRPIMIAKFRSKANMTIQGQAKPILGIDGHEYSVSSLLHCGSEEIYEQIVAAMKDKQSSFLVYADKATVDLGEFARKKQDIAQGQTKDKTIFVHVRVDRAEQIMTWSPPSLQPVLPMDLPMMPPPVREQRIL